MLWGCEYFTCIVYLTTLSHVPNDTNVAGTNGMEPYPVNWPLDALYATVTYAAQNLANLVPEEDQDYLRWMMLKELDNLHDIGPDHPHTSVMSVDRLYGHSFNIIGAAMKKDGHPKFHTWLSQALQHQAVLANAVEYLQNQAVEMTEDRIRSGKRFGDRTR